MRGCYCYMLEKSDTRQLLSPAQIQPHIARGFPPRFTLMRPCVSSAGLCGSRLPSPKCSAPNRRLIQQFSDRKCNEPGSFLAQRHSFRRETYKVCQASTVAAGWHRLSRVSKTRAATQRGQRARGRIGGKRALTLVHGAQTPSL